MKRSTRLFILGLISFFAFTGVAQNTEWAVTSSTVSFKIKNAGFNVEGSFGGLKSKIRFDATKSYSNTIEASLDVKTVNTGIGSRDGHLKKEEYFDADKYPVMSMVGSTFARQSDGSYKGYFKLTIKGVTKDVVLPFTFTESQGTGVFKGGLVLNRLDFGVGSSSMILSDNVAVSITIHVTKK